MGCYQISEPARARLSVGTEEEVHGTGLITIFCFSFCFVKISQKNIDLSLTKMFSIEIIRNTIRNLINPFKFQNILFEVINHGKCYQPLIVISLQSSKYYNNYSKIVIGYCYHSLDLIRFWPKLIT